MSGKNIGCEGPEVGAEARDHQGHKLQGSRSTGWNPPPRPAELALPGDPHSGGAGAAHPAVAAEAPRW